MKNLKTTALILICSLFLTTALQAQKVKEKDLIGNWKLIINLEEAFEEAEMEMKEDDSVLGKIVLSSVSGLVTGILDEIEIYMEFKPKGELKIMVNAFGEKEVEYSSWDIDKQGRLYIKDTNSYSSDDHDYWILQDDVLVSIDEGNSVPDKNVYMVKLD